VGTASLYLDLHHGVAYEAAIDHFWKVEEDGELKKLLSENGSGSIRAEATKTLGGVGTVVMSGGVRKGILVVQARFTT